MAVGDVRVTVVENPTALEISVALTAIRVAISASGSVGMIGLDGRAFCWGIVEA